MGGIDHKALFDSMHFPRFLVKAGEAGAYLLVDANDKALSYGGHVRDSVVGKSLDLFLRKDIYSGFRQSLDLAIKEMKAGSFSPSSDFPGAAPADAFMISPFLGPDGKIAFLDVIILPAGSGASSLQRERDDAISLLTSVFDVSEVGIIVTDRHHRIVRINDSFVRIYGWKRDDLIGKEFLMLITPDEREQARRNHEEFMKSGIRSSGEMKMIRKDGSIANALFTTAALELSHGRRFQVTTIMDITLRKQMEITLRLAKEQADTANHAKSTFLANMSHELRTPLNAILGFSEMMMKETFGPLANERYKDYLGDIHLSARHLLEIINEVLDMSKIEAGKVELDEEKFDVHDLIQAVVRMMDSRAFSSGLKIREEVEENLPSLFADPRLVRQILINIVGNAVKYSRSGGIIDVKAFIADDGDLHLVVADTGIGIPKDRIQDALEPFGQVNKPADSSNGMQGTGLGLPLAKAMAELHGGTLKLDSEVGKGTTVTVTLPARRLGSREKAGASPLAAIGKKKITQKAG
jgi:PAS domain S-box-containing protein